MAFFYKFLVILILFNMEGIFKREKGKMEKNKTVYSKRADGFSYHLNKSVKLSVLLFSGVSNIRFYLLIIHIIYS